MKTMSTEDTEETQAEEDLIAGSPTTPAPPDDAGDSGFEGRDLASDADLKSVMAQFNPAAHKDLTLMEKGVENFFLFHESPHALIRPEQMEHLGPPELKVLEERGAFERFEFVDVSENGARLSLVIVLIRPASLKADQVAKVQRACARASAASFVKHAHFRDHSMLELARDGQLGNWISERFLKHGEGELTQARSQKDLQVLMQNLWNLSIESFLESTLSLREELLIAMLRILAKPATGVEEELSQGPELSEEIKEALARRMQLPFLVALSGDYHLVQPPANHLIQFDGEVKETRSEIEWIYLLHVQIARRILINILPEEEREWIQPKGTAQDQKYLDELRKHASFAEGDAWDGAADFLHCYESLIKHMRKVHGLRKEYLVDLVTQETLKKLNMQFEPVFFHPDSFELPDASIESYIDRSDLAGLVMERMKSMSDVLWHQERRANERTPGYYFIYLYNVPTAFVENDNRRSFLHMVCRGNGMQNGIYDLLIDVTESTPRDVQDEQIRLSRAIREWEEELEKERLKRERAQLGFFQRIALWFKSLFGMGGQSQARRSDDAMDESDTDERPEAKGEKRQKRRSKRRKESGKPKDRAAPIPTRIQSAVDYVERNFRGLIWVDEVSIALKSARYTADQIGDFLFYDIEDRYAEVKPLLAIRPVYIPRDSLEDAKWRQSTLDYLQNISSQGPEHRALVDFLQTY